MAAGAGASASASASATEKHTLCGYGWGDVGGALLKAVAAGDMTKSQRWAAELVCSPGGMGRLEAHLFHCWATVMGPGIAPGWPQLWLKNIQHIRLIWHKAGGDIRTVRNTPSVRQAVAEAVAWLVLGPKRPLPPIPKPEDCFRESQAVRLRLQNGGGSGDQVACRRVWAAGQDGPDLKTIGNELEAALRANQIPKLLFWIVWLLTLDTLKDCPPVKERAPPDLTGKQRKSVAWFLVALLKDLLEEARCLPAEDGRCMWELLVTTWMKLGAKGRRDVFVAIAMYCLEKHQKSLALVAVAPPVPPIEGMKAAMGSVDTLYAEIAEEARRFLAEMPHITHLTPEAAAFAAAAAARKPVMNSMDRLDLAYKLVGR
jgi:hypothetical protein